MNITLNYTDKSFVVSGSTKEFKEQLMALGGRYNPHLKTGPGYIFSNKKEQEVTDFVENHNNSVSNDLSIIKPAKTITTNKSSNDILLVDNQLNKPVKSSYNNNRVNNTIKSPLLSTSSSLKFPNRFVGSDNLSYQIIIETCPLPLLNQKITVKYTDVDNQFETSVSSINNGSPINDIILTYVEDSTDKQTRAVILNGKWQIYLMESNHELIFH